MRSASKSHLDLVVDSSPYESPAEIVDFIAVHVGPKRLFRESVEPCVTLVAFEIASSFLDDVERDKGIALHYAFSLFID